jgi:hypothetical protein
MLKREQWLLAALLAIAATLTRAVGVALVIPMTIAWIRSLKGFNLPLKWRQPLRNELSLCLLRRAMLTVSPLVAVGIWKFSFLGQAFDYVEANYFGRGFLSLRVAFIAWSEAFQTMLSGANPQHTAYYLTEFLGLAIGIVACLAVVKAHPEIGWFSIAVLLISWSSGPAQGIHRYILSAPAVFVALARWGKHPVFDKAWTLISILLMGALAMLFAFDMWVA